ncbi:esterase/lipase family protein [Streptomyces pinistramenti]|uniref:esterase/lipase family protein n=1 Tax=Streptomyces pinistramenti TaxID=2884812 RepID=UPI001D09728D|nr:alpha/beta fold hydrolase [Streptomyces pinistramenti]MCB5908004.1 alpha/beta fold hydrolase [Streptomyces pinistramenti]
MKRTPARRRPLRRWALAAGTALCLGAAPLAATGTAQATPAPPTARPATVDGPPYPVGDLGTAVHNFLARPDTVDGANDWTCKPTARHPRPVVLTHGTFANSGANWVALAPMLANEGYCVYTLNYGMNHLSMGRIGGLADIGDSAKALGAFVDKVLAATGADKVDVVGHSQGGMMPNQYLKRLGGAAKVRTLVGIAPSNHGTTLDGLVGLGSTMNALGFVNSFLDVTGLTALKQQAAGSDFQNALWKDGDTVPGVRYVVIQTRQDKVVTPYTNAFLHGEGVTDVLLQDQCPDDKVGHAGLFLDSPALQNVMNALGPADPHFRPTCTGYGPAA